MPDAPTYRFKIPEELVWFLLAAGLPPILAAFATFDPEQITDWRAWLVSVIAASIRALAGAGLAWFGKRATS